MITHILNILNIIFAVAFMLCYAYQVIFIVISLIKKPRAYAETDKRYRYAFLISARNEEGVIDQLCDCIRAQDYSEELIDIYVVADNCTDCTKDVAREHGAIVYERFNDKLIGKGYALSELLKYIDSTVGYDAYDGYFVVDADNILEPDYVSEMNKCYAAGERLVIGYRNSKNYGDNWISAGYSLWFLRESRQLNGVRSVLGTSSEIKGTGFLIHKDIIKRQGGWVHHLLIEDVEFTVDNVLKGEKVAYCHAAILYDEQPTGFMTSWWQRKRWCRGYLQVLGRYAFKLIGAFFKGRGFSNYDMLMAMSPAFFISVAAVATNILGLIATLIFDTPAFVSSLLGSVILGAASYILFAILAFLTVMTEKKRIRATGGQMVMSVLTFPIFMATYIPIAAASMFSGTDWKPIKHNRVEGDSKISVPEKKAEEQKEEKELETADK